MNSYWKLEFYRLGKKLKKKQWGGWGGGRLWGGGWQLPLLYVRGLIVGLSKFDHISSYLFDLHWLLVIYLLLLVYKALNNQAPDYIKASLHKTNPTLRLRSNDRNLLDVPRTNHKTSSDRAFPHSGPFLWNNLPKVQLRLFLNQS